jgi:small nuclear ribonucleoprotein
VLQKLNKQSENVTGMVNALKPLSVLAQAMESQVMVELKGNRGYRGVLDGYDPHMNLVLKNAEELVNNEVVRKLEVAIVRGDNVIYISP